MYALAGSSIWVIHPTIEAIGFAVLVSWYDRHPWRGPVMDFIAKGGTYSYGIYLLHVFNVTATARFIDDKVQLDSVLNALPFALLYFIAMGAIASVVYRWVEAPFVNLRRPYAGTPGKLEKERSQIPRIGQAT